MSHTLCSFCPVRSIPTFFHIALRKLLRTSVKSSSPKSLGRISLTIGTGAGRAGPNPAGSTPLPGCTRAPFPFISAQVAPAISPNTNPSSSELLASRFAPCSPVLATSPAAYNPGTSVRPCASVRTPPTM